jgi:hypothetical protein
MWGPGIRDPRPDDGEATMARPGWGSKLIPSLGYTGRIIVHADAPIRERIARVAYARNGNAGNPGVIKEWDVWSGPEHLGGRCLLACRTLREAKEAAEGFRATGETVTRCARSFANCVGGCERCLREAEREAMDTEGGVELE